MTTTLEQNELGKPTFKLYFFIVLSSFSKGSYSAESLTKQKMFTYKKQLLFYV